MVIKLRSKKSDFFAVTVVICILNSQSTTAQIVPDNTLPIKSIVTPQGNTSIITGGTRAGSNLFHSFAQFSIPTRGTAYFNNKFQVQNIISRVTGGSISNIDGLIRANGTANLFLINPNGIIFGPNASLNIGGSFLATTASSLNFPDGTEFSARNPQSSPLLTVSVPIGLQFGVNPQGIYSQSHTTDITGSPIGLQVLPGKTLALVGGNVALEGGILTAPGGRVELGSVANPGFVSITSTNKGWELGYENVPFFGSIQLSQLSAVNTSGVSTGDIQVQGSQVTIQDNSELVGINMGSEPGGTITVNAKESLELNGRINDPETFTSNLLQTENGKINFTDPRNGVFNVNFGSGAGGSIVINTPSFISRNGAFVTTSTFGSGRGGDITVNSKSIVASASALATGSFAAGSAGDLTINTEKLIISNGTDIFSGSLNQGQGGNLTISTNKLVSSGGAEINTITYGSGNAGNLSINASDSVDLSGTTPDGQFSSGLSSQTQGTGNAGNLIITTRKLKISQGAQITSNTISLGNAGNLSINASDSVELSGTTPGGPSLLSSFARSGTADPGGNITISTGQLTVQNGAEITVKNEGIGNAGLLQIDANKINLNNQGSITASTTSGQGGNIFLNAQNLQLRHNSAISATANGGSGNGGNINTKTLLFTALEGSSVTANALGGNGGNIKINTEGLFRSPDSLFTASSTFGISGTVEFNIPFIDFARAAAVPPPPPQSPKVGSICSGGGAPGSLVTPGTGGSPPSSNDLLDGDRGWYSNPSPTQLNRKTRKAKKSDDDIDPKEFVPVTGWVIHPDGTMNFTSDLPGNVPYISSGCSQAQAAQ